MPTDSTLIRLGGWRKLAAGSGGIEGCSLVVATYERPAELSALLATVRDLPDVPMEVVVIDGSVNDFTNDAVAAWAAATDLPYDLAYVRSPAGLTRQRNVGIDASSGSVVFFLDDDCSPQPGYFRAIHDVFAADTEGRIGAVSGLVINEIAKPLSVRWRLRLALGLVPRPHEPERYYPTATSVPRCLVDPFDGVRGVDVMPGCSMAFRRAVLERHRFSNFFYGYSQGEDLEMSLRVGSEYEILCCGDARVIHDHAPGGRPASAQKGRMEVRNRYFIWKRHSADARFADRVRFWGDIAYITMYNVATFVARPLSLAPLAHAAGCIRGAVECLITPPRYTEPTARREYDVTF